MRRGSSPFAASLVVASAFALVGCGARVGPQLSQGTPELGAGAAGATAPLAATNGSGPSAASSTTSTTGAPVGSPQVTGRTTTTVSAHNNSNAASSSSTLLAPPAAGTYTYKQSGSFTAGGSTSQVPPTGTIVVDAPSNNSGGTWNQVWHSYVNTKEPPTDETFLMAPSGISIVSELIQMTYGGQTFSFDCTFVPPIKILPWPVRVGYTFSGSGNCGSNFNLSVSGAITGTEQVMIDGTQVTTYVVDTTVKSTGQVTSTDNEVDWFDPALRLDVHSDTRESGSDGPFAFSSQVTRDLESGHPG